jgi:hypothetical protein
MNGYMITIGRTVQTTTAIFSAAVGAASPWSWYCAVAEAPSGRPCVDMSIRCRTTWIGWVSRPGV